MINKILNSIGSIISIVLFMSCGTSDERNLFNGETLEGWERSDTFFRMEEAMTARKKQVGL